MFARVSIKAIDTTALDLHVDVVGTEFLSLNCGSCSAESERGPRVAANEALAS